TMTHYDGTDSQTVDSTLSAAIAGFADAYTGWAYTVFVVPTGTITGFPQTARIEAVVRGRLVFDPRDDSTAYSQNPALCMADFIQSADYGPGLVASGVDDCADYCDETISSTARCEIGIAIQPMELDQALDLFA